MNYSHVLVTGGAGFIGSHLCRYLLANGKRVYCIDNLSTGSLDNIADLIHNPNFVWLRHDVAESFRLTEIDAVFALACPESPLYCKAHPEQTIRTCVSGIYYTLELARRAGIPIVFASGSAVYGKTEIISPAISIQQGCISPRSVYDEGKRCAETMCFDYRLRYGLNVKVARIFSTYGPAMQIDSGLAICNFIKRALRGDPLQLLGDGSQQRSFCFISDTISALCKLMNTPENVSGPLNIGNSAEISIRELAEQILKLTGSKSQIEYRPLPCDESRNVSPDMTLTEQVLNWKPEISIGDGLAETIRSFKERLNKNE